MAEQVIEKAKQILEGLEDGHFETAKDWSPATQEPFYLYFSVPDSDTRKLALLVFAAAIGNSRRGVARILHSEQVIADSSGLEDEDLSRYAYSVDRYFLAFLANQEAIKDEFPLLYRVILAETKLWHQENSFFTLFPGADKALLDGIVEVIKDVTVRNSDLNLDPMLKEIGWNHLK